MDYPIGKVAKLLGISVEAVRNYEKSGITMAKREEYSGYRSFSYLDIASLIRARMYRSYGFSLKETNVLTNDSGLEDILGSLHERRKELEGEQCLLSEKIACIEELEEQIREAERENGRVSVCLSPAVYRMEFSRNGEIDFSEKTVERFQAWMRLEPFVYMSSRYAGGDVYGGLAVRERYARVLGLEAGEGVTFHPAVPAVGMTVVEEDRGFSRAETLEALRDYAAYHRFDLSEEAIGHTVAGIHKAQEYRRYRRVYWPIREN